MNPDDPDEEMPEAIPGVDVPGDPPVLPEQSPNPEPEPEEATIGWEELGDKEKVERLAENLNTLVMTIPQAFNALGTRIQVLELMMKKVMEKGTNNQKKLLLPPGVRKPFTLIPKTESSADV